MVRKSWPALERYLDFTNPTEPGLPARSNLKVTDGRSALNTKRPQNPFIPTDEPDWKWSEARRSPIVRYDNRKDWESYSISPTSGWNEPLPVGTSFDLPGDNVTLREDNSKCSSQSPVVSMSSNVARKMAPPVPKKPALLSNSQRSQEKKINNQESTSRPPPGGQTIFDDGAKKGLPPSPLRRSKQQGTRETGFDESYPSPRSIGAIVSVSNGLMDEEIEGASTIPSLQPMRRRQ